MQETLTLLRTRINEKDIFENEPMNKHTTFKVGGNADIFIKVNTIEDIKFILEVGKKFNKKIFIFGNGSNLIVRDNGIRGIVIKNELKKFEILKNKNEAIVTAGSGNKLSEISKRLMNEGISGFEFAAGIPGTIGGFVKMNAGAYGKEAKDIVSKTRYMDYSGNIKEIENQEHKFNYRESFFKDKELIILETQLKLSYGNFKDIKHKQEELLKQRKEKQPVNYPNAGSIFKRDANFITSKLIEQCGLKGFNIGGAEISTKHAGFIINKGNASANDIIELIKYIKKIVYEKTGNEIQLEVEIIGEE